MEQWKLTVMGIGQGGDGGSHDASKQQLISQHYLFSLHHWCSAWWPHIELSSVENEKKKSPIIVANNSKGDLGHDERDLPLVADEDTNKRIRRWPMTLTCNTLQHLWAREWRAPVAEPFQVIGPVFISIYSQTVLVPIPSHKFPFPSQKRSD